MRKKDLPQDVRRRLNLVSLALFMILLVGASASGKTEIGKILEEEYNINKIITYTTRAKRINEHDDVDYHFITKEQFLKFKECGFFFETMLYGENFYGTAYKDFNDDSYLIVDPKGLKQYKNANINTTAFYLNCSSEIRRKRMISRGDSIVDIERRLRLDEHAFAIKFVSEADYIINTDIKSINQLANEIYSIYKKC